MADRLRIPVPDPFGVIKDLTKNLPIQTFDPLKDAIEMEEKIETEREQPQVKEEKGNGYIEGQIQKYEYHLIEAYKAAPCSGCKNLVQSALVGVRIYKEMESGGRKREEFTNEEIQRIKEGVRKELETLIP